ncbi:MAG: hypothetical protein P8J33_05240 [Pirellulaceae bacterium]|nr:hypothetical protein [Pirellulaceae bacterium]
MKRKTANTEAGSIRRIQAGAFLLPEKRQRRVSGSKDILTCHANFIKQNADDVTSRRAIRKPWFTMGSPLKETALHTIGMGVLSTEV